MGLASLALVTSIAGGAVSAYGSYQQGKAQQYAAEHNAEVAKNQAKAVEEEARENSKRERGNNERMLATMRARLAAQGTGIDYGAPIAVLGDTASELELSVLDGYRSAENQRSSLLSQATMSKWEGGQARKAGVINAFGGLLGTAGKAYGQYTTGKKAGLF